MKILRNIKKLLKKSAKVKAIFFTGSLTLFALMGTAVSTMAWYSHLNAPITGVVESGSTSLTINTITGYKEVDGEPKSITVTPSNEVTDNDDQGTEDTSLDVPTQGVGYYLIPQVTGVYRYSNATKFTELVGGDTTRAYINSISLTAGNSYQVKKYTFLNGKTVSQAFSFSASDLYGGVAAAGTHDWTVNTGKSGTYKVWLDYQNNTLGFESTSVLPASLASEVEPEQKAAMVSTQDVEGDKRLVERPKLASASSTTYSKIIFYIPNTATWDQDGAIISIWGHQTSSWYDFTNSFKYGSTTVYWVDVGTNTTGNLVRLNPTDGSFNKSGTDRMGAKWNQTSDLKNGDANKKDSSLSNYKMFQVTGWGENDFSFTANYYDRWYLVGENAGGKSLDGSSNTTFSTTGGIPLDFDTTGSNIAKHDNISFKAGDKFKAYTSTNNTWVGNGAYTIATSPVDFSAAGIFEADGDGNLVVQQDVTCTIYINSSSQMHIDPNRNYTATLDLNGKTATNTPTGSVTATYGSAMPTGKTMPTATGYTFQGYYDTSADSGGTKYYNANGTPATNWNKTANTTLYARWTAKQSALTFNKGDVGGDTVSNLATSVTATYGADMPTISPLKPTRTGYVFAGYYDASSDGVQYYDANGASTRSWNKDKTDGTTLYARWTPGVFTISLNNHEADAEHGGTANIYEKYNTGFYKEKGCENAYATSGDSAKITIPVKTGYIFDGYYTDNNVWSNQIITSTGHLTTNNLATTFTANGELHAKWTAKQSALTFDINDGDAGAVTSAPATYGRNMPTLTVTTALAKSGWAFQGFYDSKSGGTQYYTAGLQSARTWDKDTTSGTTLYAQWKQISFTLAYNGGGGTGDDPDGGEPKNVDSDVTLAGTNVYSKEHYHYTSWDAYLDNSQTPFVTEISSSYRFRADQISEDGHTVTLKPHWEIDTYTVTIQVGQEGYGSLTETSLTVAWDSSISTSGTTITIGGNSVTANAASATNAWTYAFDYWGNATDNVIEDRTITANFTRTGKTYTVRFYGNGSDDGSSTAPMTVTYGDSAKPLTTNGFTKVGYHFTGWNTETNGSGASYADGASVSNLTADLALYAQWEINTYAVTVISGGNGTASVASSPISHGSTASLTATPSTGYHLDHWEVSYDDGSSWSSAESSANPYTPTITQVSKYKAVFAINLYTVSFTTGGQGSGTLSDSSIANVPYGTSITVNGNAVTINGTTITATAGDPTAQYTYSFSSWSNASGTITDARTITANFGSTVNKYTVTITVNNGDYGSVDETSIANVPYGTSISNSGTVLTIGETKVNATPTTNTAQYRYALSPWTNGSGSVEGNVTITANFTRDINSYQIAALITPSGKGTVTGTATYAYGASVTLAASPSTGYRFVHWTFGGVEQSTNASYTFTVAPATGSHMDTLTYTAVFEAKTYNISFSDNGGSGGVSTTVTATYDSAMPSVPNNVPTRTGYDFAGYGAYGNVYYKDDLTPNRNWDVDADTELQAQWTPHQHTINLYVNGGSSISPSSSLTHTYGISESLAGYTATKSDYTFKGWYDSASGGNRITSVPEDLDDDVGYYAQYMMVDGFAAGEIIYFVPNSNWSSKNAKFAAYFYNAGNNTWRQLTAVGDGSYSVEVPQVGFITEWKVIFARLMDTAADNQTLYSFDDDTWNKCPNSGSVPRSDSSKDVFVMNGNDSAENWNYYDGTWKKHIDTDTYTFYYVDNRGTWTNHPGAYAWDSNHEDANGNDDGYYYPSFHNGDWPGVVMSHPAAPIVKNVNGTNYTIPVTYIWEVTVSKSFNRIIFNSGTSANANADQTIDMHIATSGTEESKAHDNWFFVLDGNYDQSGKATGLWKETILPVNIYASYFDQDTKVATVETDLGWSCYTFGNEKYTPTPVNGNIHETLYYGHNQNGTFYVTTLYKDEVSSAIKYYTDAACTQEFNVGNANCPQNCTLYVKYNADTSSGYITIYLDCANTEDDSWDNTSECYFHLGTKPSDFSAYSPSNNNVWSTSGFTGLKISSCLYRITIPANSYWFAFNDQVDSRDNTSDQFGHDRVGISAGNASTIFVSDGSEQELYRKVATATNKDTSSYGTATIQINGESPITMGVGDGADNNYFIYESGVNVNAGDTILVHVTGSSVGGMSEYLDATQYASALPNYLAVQFTVTGIPNDWDTPYVYAWNALGNQNAEFPGVTMQATATAGTYTFTLTAGYTQMVLSNGTSSQQTKDLTLNYGKNVWSIGSLDEGVSKFNATNSTYSSATPMKLVALERARLNFYVTNSKQLSIASVPFLGNGYYIMTGSSGNGFTDGFKLYSSADGTSAAYDHFKVTPGASYFIRSYIDAVDKEYRTIVFDDYDARDSYAVVDPNVEDSTLSKLIVFKSTLSHGNYFDFKVDTDGRVHVATSSGDTSSFFRIGYLEADLFGANNTARSISDQRTSLVLKVTVTLANIHEMDFSAIVTPANGLGSIAGVAMYVTDSALGDPYNYMRNNYLNSLTVLGNNKTVVAASNPFKASATEGTQTLYIYLLFDYVISTNNIPGTSVNTAGSFNVTLQANQVVEEQA